MGYQVINRISLCCDICGAEGEVSTNGFRGVIFEAKRKGWIIFTKRGPVKGTVIHHSLCSRECERKWRENKKSHRKPKPLPDPQ